MSNRTIRIVDVYCEVANWNASIAGVAAEKADPKAYAFDKNQIDGEITRWTILRDRRLALLRKLVGALTDKEKDLIRRRYRPAQLVADLKRVGVELVLP